MLGSCCYSSSLDVSLSFLFPFQDGWTALHKAIIGKKQAITNYLLRESANPFVLDKVSLNFYLVLLINYICKLQDNDAISKFLPISNIFSSSIIVI